MDLPYFVVDAFTRTLFGGNPAAVVPLTTWPDDSTLQAIAAENNLAETAFFVRSNDDSYHLRWFTPTLEVDLCGHATIASAFVLMQHREPGLNEVVFRSKSGDLRVTRTDDLYALDFPSRMPTRVPPPADLIAALGVEPDEVWKSRDYMVVYSSEQRVRSLAPDMFKLASIDMFAVIATAASSTPGSDFVSRFFAPGAGINEDPVTGSAHCTLIPYWSGQLGKKDLVARQISARGGELFCTDRGERVTIAGGAVLYATGTIHLP